MSDFDTSDFDVFLSEFATTVTCSTWGTTVEAIFDEESVFFEDNSGAQPSLLMPTSLVHADATSGDLFTFIHPTTKLSVTYKLVDRQASDPGFDRIVLALV